MLSIVIPTYNESGNIDNLLKQIDSALDTIEYEVVFVDDSRDNTPEILAKIASRDKRIRFKHRENGTGLSSAVIEGFSLAKGEYIAVMDADLQHPPSVLRDMYCTMKSGADICIPSRFIPGGSDGGLDIFRKIVSSSARYMGKIMISSLRSITDPTSGLFMFKREVIDTEEKLKPIGWKIMIEVLALGKYKKVVEVPYKFQDRNAGESKLSMKVTWEYIKQLCGLLFRSKKERRFISFALIGALGVVVDSTILMLLPASISLSIRGGISAFLTMIWNFILNNAITYKDFQGKKESILFRLSKYVASCGLGILLKVGLLKALSFTNINELILNLIAIAIVFVFNYALCNKFVWKTEKEDKIVVERWSKDKVKEEKKKYNL